jgi:riboflavin kinase
MILLSRGFQRGSKELGIPTANLSMDQLGVSGEQLETGIYYGWALLKGKQYEAVVSVGWNPFYKNVKKTVEAHLLEEMDDFYGDTIQVSLYGYLRNEADFKSLDELISCIQSDISMTRKRLTESPRPVINPSKL